MREPVNLHVGMTSCKPEVLNENWILWKIAQSDIITKNDLLITLHKGFVLM